MGGLAGKLRKRCIVGGVPFGWTLMENDLSFGDALVSAKY